MTTRSMPRCGFWASSSRGTESLAVIRDRMPNVVNTPELRFPCSADAQVRACRRGARAAERAGAEVSEIDGVRVKTPDGWWLLRASNTQDVLVARVEAKDESALKRLKAELAAQLRQSGVAPPPGF